MPIEQRDRLRLKYHLSPYQGTLLELLVTNELVTEETARERLGEIVLRMSITRLRKALAGKVEIKCNPRLGYFLTPKTRLHLAKECSISLDSDDWSIPKDLDAA
jgi:hypothetical protein